MRIAMTISVKNDRTLLRFNLLYHHYLGVEKFYIFSDGSTDDTIKTVEDLSFVQTGQSVSPGYFEGRSELRHLVEKAATHFSARHCLNICTAMELAKEEGMDWIIAIDADELLCLDVRNAYRGQFITFFTFLRPSIDLIRFLPMEVVQ